MNRNEAVNNDGSTPHQADSIENGTSVSDWYDGFSEIQMDHGINIRHRTIMRAAKTAGYRDGMRVLEIGCGIGTVTSLLAHHNSSGLILALDISPKSVEFAKRNLTHRPNVRFMVSDMSDFQHEGLFDFVVLPDVIEHIPLDQHPKLFGTIAKYMAPDGKILLMYPVRNYLSTCTSMMPKSCR